MIDVLKLKEGDIVYWLNPTFERVKKCSFVRADKVLGPGKTQYYDVRVTELCTVERDGKEVSFTHWEITITDKTLQKCGESLYSNPQEAWQDIDQIVENDYKDLRKGLDTPQDLVNFILDYAEEIGDTEGHRVPHTQRILNVVYETMEKLGIERE